MAAEFPLQGGANSMVISAQERPEGPLNIDPGITPTPSSDITALEDEEYIDGFSWRTVIGALFMGFIMMPGAIYLGLIAGQGMGAAAEWVTIILFMEVARRSYQTLKKQEIYLLYYIGSALTSQAAGVALYGGAFAGLIWAQYNSNSPVSQQLGVMAPSWVAPNVNTASGAAAIAGRTFFSSAWTVPIVLLMVGQVLGRMTNWGLGYVMFRITSDIERLPFPLAPIVAEGAVALAESSSQKEGWRWRIFSIGTMIGLGWGVIYILIPAVTGLIFSQPITIISNPFIDYSANTKNILPAAPVSLGTDLGAVFIGFVLPLPIVVGSFIASVGCYIVANPILYRMGILHSWQAGTDVIQTGVANTFDFYLSFGIGVAAMVGVIGLVSVVLNLLKATRRDGGTAPLRLHPPKGRGDIPIWSSLLIWAVGTTGYIVLCQKLVPGFPLGMLLFFGFVWTPLVSYINARMIGLAGASVSIPYVREASVMMSGYRGTDIWFAPIPINDYGGMAQQFRIVELTKTKFISILKAEALILPVTLGCSLLFWSFIWKLAPVPSSVYPFASKYWPVSAQVDALWRTANKDGGSSVLRQAINPYYIGAGSGVAAIAFGVVTVLGLPTLLFYGFINGTTGLPGSILLQFIGAMLGRFYFSKKYGAENWRAYAPVLTAGFFCGLGLTGMASVSVALLSKSVSRLPF